MIINTNFKLCKCQKNTKLKKSFVTVWLKILILATVLGSGTAMAVDMPFLHITDSAGGDKSYSLTLQIIALMTLLSLLPAIVLTMTSFTRIIIVLSILRQAMGMPQTPSNQILLGVSLFLTFFIMSPVFTNIYENAIVPISDSKISVEEGIKAAWGPLSAFMEKQVRKSDVEFFFDLKSKSTNTEVAENNKDIPFSVLLPAFVTSELKTAFQIGFYLFIPFLIIDLVVASVLMSMGMMMMSPLIISLPFKIMVFVMVDGWTMIVDSLTSSFSGFLG